MTCIKTNTLTRQQVAEIETLQKICFDREQLKNETFLSNTLNTDRSISCFFLHYREEMLVGFLEALFPTTAEVEINGFVHPDYRRRGIFSSLVTEARKTYQDHGFLQMLLQVEPSSRSGKSYLDTRFPHIDRSEHSLRLSKSRWQEQIILKAKKGTLVEATGAALKPYIQVAASLLREETDFIQQMLDDPKRRGYLYLHENKPVGVLQSSEKGEGSIMLHGLAIDEAYRGQGHGKAMLSLALDRLFQSCESISLEVDAQNPRALGLYRALGFEIDFQVDYHALNLSYL